MIVILESHNAGNLSDCVLGGLYQFFRLLQTDSLDVLLRGYAHILAEQVSESVLAQLHHGCKILVADVFCGMFVYLT